jgi:hypothetical protein
MEKQMRAFKQLAQFRLLEKANKTDRFRNMQFTDELLQFPEQRSLPSDHKERIWKFIRKDCERPQGGG